MGTGYTRTNTSDIQADEVVKSAPLNAELNAVVNAFAASTGHTHDGTAAEAAEFDLDAHTAKLQLATEALQRAARGLVTDVALLPHVPPPFVNFLDCAFLKNRTMTGIDPTSFDYF